MKQIIGLLFFCVAVCVLTSCSDAKYPIDDHPLVKIDNRLLGNWIIKEKNKPTPDRDMVYTLSRQDDFQYLVSMKEKGKGKKKETSGSCYLSEIDNVPFLNICDKSDSGGYTFFKILSVDPKRGKVTVANIADTTMMLLTSAAQVRERITTNLNNPLFYKDTAEFYRVK